MERQVKYFKFFDPYNPLILTKDIGFSVDHVETLKIQRQNEAGEWIVHHDESKPVVLDHFPPYEGAVEISKEEYDFITGEGESEEIKNRREFNLQALYRKKGAELSPEEIKAEQEKIHNLHKEKFEASIAS